MESLAWREAWHEALYAAGSGFYVRAGGPAAHFSTAASGPTAAVLAQALLQLAPRPPAVVVDVGAGAGELATCLLRALGPDAPHARVLAVDVTERPEQLDARVEWLRSPGGAALPAGLRDLDDALVVAHEWLDVVPCTIAEVDGDGVLREVLADPRSGAELLGPAVEEGDREWARRHWPAHRPGARVEIGRARDEAWSDLVDRVRTGVLVAVDYGHIRASRPANGTLTAYRRGRQTRPVPDGSCDLTAHVAVDSLEHDALVRQRDALRGLGATGRVPDVAVARRDPAGYLLALAQASREARLLEPDGYGGFWWVIKRVPPAAIA